ncbi:MAG: HD domain-containing protein [Halanaerobiales bacterium]|nr:HD domain-containing protein [Halanaerobiales bacterium]
MESPGKYDAINNLNNLNNISELYNKIEINKKEISFNLVIFDISLDKNNVEHHEKIILLEKLIKTIDKYRDFEIELFYFNESNLIVCSKNDIDNFIKDIIENLNSFEISINNKTYEIKINYGKLNYPEEAKNYNQIITKLKDNLDQNKEEFKFHTTPAAIKINKKDEYIDEIKKDSTQLYLIAKDKNTEIIRQDIIANKSIEIAAGDDNNFELFYIIKGKLIYDNDKILYPGDSITVKSGEKEIYFKTITDTTLLYLTSSPIFAGYQKRINKILSLNKNIAEKDIETNEHCLRLQKLSRITGSELGLNDKKLFNLGFASFLHDIGKAKVPATILQKPNKLSDKEWEIMKKHTIWGKEIILEQFNSKKYVQIVEIINQHHEKFDGSGYPNRLKGNEIRIEAQILSVVDAYDAMTNDRPYQKAMSKEKAIEEIKFEKGKQFSPKVVDAFIKAILKYDNK